MKGSITRKDGESKLLNTTDVTGLEPTEMSFPVRDLEDPDLGLVLGLRQNMVDVEEIDASVSVGAGLGTDFIILQYGERTLVVRGSEMLKRWITSFDPEVGDRIPGKG